MACPGEEQGLHVGPDERVGDDGILLKDEDHGTAKPSLGGVSGTRIRHDRASGQLGRWLVLSESQALDCCRWPLSPVQPIRDQGYEARVSASDRLNVGLHQVGGVGAAIGRHAVNETKTEPRAWNWRATADPAQALPDRAQ